VQVIHHYYITAYNRVSACIKLLSVNHPDGLAVRQVGQITAATVD